MPKVLKVRLLGLFLMTQRGVTVDDRRSLIQTSRLTGPEQQILLNFERLGNAMYAAQGPSRTGVFSMFKSKPAAQHAAMPEGNYDDTRHVPELRNLLDQLMTGNLPTEKYAAAGPSAPVAGESKVASVRTRKFGAGGDRAHTAFSGGRYLVFIAGGVCYSELRVASELEAQYKKEVIIGGSCIVNPKAYVKCVAGLDATSEGAELDEPRSALSGRSGAIAL